MAYDKKELEKQALKLIEENGLTFIDDLAAFLPCTRSTFYKKDLHKTDTIKEAIWRQKKLRKYEMRKKWEKSENATLNLASYKLLADDDELEKLNNNKQKVDITSKGEQIKSISPMQWVNDSKD